MAGYLEAQWEPSWDAPLPRDRRGGHYRPYLPDPLSGRSLVVDADLARQAARAEVAARSLRDGPGATSLEGLARFLLRSEAIASSRIEGLQVSPQQVALAEVAAIDGVPVRGFSENARLVANNITTLRQAATDLAEADAVTVEGIAGLQQALLPNARHLGLRNRQNWIGGSDWHPLDAEFVPPPGPEVERLVMDLAQYASGGAHAPLVQAGLLHAQFETIHPFVDGNGRVGRALIHTVLTRRGLTRAAVLPVSLVLLTRSDEYVRGLTAYRYQGPADGADARSGTAEWLRIFLAAVEIAVDQARRFADEVEMLRVEWSRRHHDYRARIGKFASPRRDSAVARLLALLPEVPVVTARTAQHRLQVSFHAARNAAEELAEAGILHRKKVERGTTGYLARDVFEVLTFAERRLASTRWDTRESQPGRPVPGLP